MRCGPALAVRSETALAAGAQMSKPRRMPSTASLVDGTKPGEGSAIRPAPRRISARLFVYAGALIVAAALSVLLPGQLEKA